MGRQDLIGRLLRGATRSGAPATEEAASVDLGDRRVDLVVRRSVRRTLALQLDHRGVRVAAPHGTPQSAVEHFVRSHRQWLLDRLSAQAARGQGQRLVLADGSLLPVLGKTVRLRMLGGRRPQWKWAADGVEELHLGAGADASVLLRSLRQRALDWFGGRVAEYCHRLALPVPPVRLSSARTRWGSCSLRSGIRLHWRLIHLPPALIDYVVAHEVAHLIEMNHSPRFWSVVAGLYPDWQHARRQLREQGAALPVIDPEDTLSIAEED